MTSREEAIKQLIKEQLRKAAFGPKGYKVFLFGSLQETKSHPDYAKSFFAGAWDPRAIGQVYQSSDSDWPFAMADFRAYDRALRDEEIVALSLQQ